MAQMDPTLFYALLVFGAGFGWFMRGVFEARYSSSDKS